MMTKTIHVGEIRLGMENLPFLPRTSTALAEKIYILF